MDPLDKKNGFQSQSLKKERSQDPIQCEEGPGVVAYYGRSSRLLAATTLRNVLGTLTLGDILSQREYIAR